MSTPELPMGWTQVPLEALVVDGPRNGLSPPATGKERGPLALKLSATTAGEMRISAQTTKRLDEPIAAGSSAWLEPGDLLVQRSNTLNYVGASAIYEGPTQTYVYPDLMMRLRVADAALRKYLWCYLNSEGARRYFRDRATGTAGNMPKINGATLRTLPVPLPPAEVIPAIVAKLDALRARSRRARDALDAVPALVDRLRQSILAAAFRGDLTADWREQHGDVEPASELLKRIRIERRRRWEEAELAKLIAKGKPPKDDRWKAKYVEPEPPDESDLPELPETWCWSSVDDVSELQLGQQRDPRHAAATRTYPYLRAANITWDGFDLSDVKEMGFPDAERYLLRDGDVLMSEASGSASEVGKPAIWRGPIASCCYQKTLLRARPVSAEAGSEWLHLCFLADALLGRFARMAPGVGILHLTAERMRSWPVPLAPRQEQERIVSAVRAALDRCSRLADLATNVTGSVADAEAAVLASAFRGELLGRQSVPSAPDYPETP